MLKCFFVSKTASCSMFLALGLLLSTSSVQAETVLHNFCSSGNCTDGSTPTAGLAVDSRGNLYGTTLAGGAHGQGVVFRLTPQGKETTYSFCAKTNCADGAMPGSSLIFDAKGNIYGTTAAGGANSGSSCPSGCGVVFKITSSGIYSVLYDFCAVPGCADGSSPLAGLVVDGSGNLYGTTRGGGSVGSGTVFEFTAAGIEKVLYSFCQSSSCSDGQYPQSPLILDQSANVYGTTSSGGASNSVCFYGCGVVFKVTQSGKESVLHSFCETGVCTDGSDPNSGLYRDSQGNLYGTTVGGGVNSQGVVFKLTSSGEESVLYSFCSMGGSNCSDGANPFGGVISDASGNLYGTTSAGGENGLDGGTVFSLSPTGTETVLFSFCTTAFNCQNGKSPNAPLVSSKNVLYGTTSAGGTASDGTVFSLPQ